ncbi:MAG: hypothetical protein K8T90_20200 [Planctomycetes bacterium]|nr:hypothetical protein [Planctomycetota bacterium]
MTFRTTSIRRRRGTSLVETTIASAILVVVLGAAFPVMKSVSDAGDQGRTRSWTQADNRQALNRIARDVMNGSLTTTDTSGNLRFEITVGLERSTLTGDTGCVNGSRTLLTSSQIGGTKVGIGDAANYYKTTTAGALGSGTRGGTRIGRTRSAGFADEISTGALRPRELQFGSDSVLRFQKILDYAFDASGEPVINWGNWVEYRVQGRNLVRIENGVTRVISSNTSGFRVEATPANTLMITLVSERRSADGKDIARQANQVEVLPKN